MSDIVTEVKKMLLKSKLVGWMGALVAEVAMASLTMVTEIDCNVGNWGRHDVETLFGLQDESIPKPRLHSI